MPEGLKDAEKCIELDPTFSKGYTRKGAVQFSMKEYDKALETYREGLKHDPNNEELLDGIRRYGIVLHSCYFWELILPLSICTMTMRQPFGSLPEVCGGKKCRKEFG